MTRLVIIGFMGCGKSATGIAIARKLNYDFIDLDTFIENKYRKTINQLFETVGEEGFRAIETEELAKVLTREMVVIAAGGGTPCYNNNIDIINQNADSIYLKLKPEQLAKRLKHGTINRPLIKNLHGPALLEYIDHKLAERESYYLKAKYIITIEDENAVDLADQILNTIQNSN